MKNKIKTYFKLKKVFQEICTNKQIRKCIKNEYEIKLSSSSRLKFWCAEMINERKEKCNNLVITMMDEMLQKQIFSRAWTN